MSNLPKLKTNQELIYSDLTYKIRKALFNVYNTLGFGHKESVYQKALEKEFIEMKIPYEKEQSLNVSYRNQVIGTYRPDFVIDQKVILELKAVELMPKTFEIQLLHYLKTTGFKLGLLINFGAPRLFIKRLIWTDNPRKSVLNLRES